MRSFAVASALALATASAPALVPRPVPRAPAVVAIVPPVLSVATQESEAYADFADNLNAYAAEPPAGLRVTRVAPARWNEAVRQPRVERGFSVLFLRADGQVLLYLGMVLEPQVYDMGGRWALGGPPPDRDYGLIRTRLLRR